MGHLICFHPSAIGNNAAVNTEVQISLQDPAFDSLGSVPRIGIAGSHGSSVFLFLRNHHTVFHSSSTILYSHKDKKVPFSPPPRQHSLSLVFLVIAILTYVRCYLLVLIYIFLIIEHCVICLLTICLLLEKSLFKFFAYFLIRFFIIKL